jgi:alkylhydroperoxidase/carboxymuconolactone decarboxylase family protein YurZ
MSETHPFDAVMRGILTSDGPNQTRALDQVLKHRQQMLKRMQDVLDDRSRTAVWKRAELARLVESFRVQKDRLQQEHRRELEERQAKLLRKAFGPGSSSDMQQWREAATAAAGLENQDQAMIAVGIARRAGDESWLRAFASAAYEKGWTAVLDAYITDRPEVAEALAEVASSRDKRRQFEDSVAFSGLTVPIVPDRGPAEIEAEREESRAPFPTYSARVVDFGRG